MQMGYFNSLFPDEPHSNGCIQVWSPEEAMVKKSNKHDRLCMCVQKWVYTTLKTIFL